MENLIRQLLAAAKPGVALRKATTVDDETPTADDLTQETYLGVKLQQTYAGPSGLDAGTKDYHYPATVPDDEFALSGQWSADDESITAKAGAAIRLNFNAADVYLDIGGTGTITATVGTERPSGIRSPVHPTSTSSVTGDRTCSGRTLGCRAVTRA